MTIRPVLNSDGISVRGCTYIYAPAGQAGEYAPLATNPYRGCGHGCVYCYVPAVIHISRTEFDRGANLRDSYFSGLLKDARKYEALGLTDQVMLSFTSDPYHPGDTLPTRKTLEILIEHGMSFCTLTKGGMRALRDCQTSKGMTMPIETQNSREARIETILQDLMKTTESREGVVLILLGERGLRVGSYGASNRMQNIRISVDNLLGSDVFRPDCGQIDAKALLKFALNIESHYEDAEFELADVEPKGCA